MKAFGYVRVSGKGQLDGDGFSRQKASIQAYAHSVGFEIVEFAEERGVSGTTEGTDRQAWADLIARITLDGSTTTVLVERLDRIARDLLVQEHIIADLRKRGITLISAAEPDLCHDDPSRKLLRQIMGAIAEYDKSMIVAKTRAARERIRRSGKPCEGAKPYGHASKPDEAQVLQRMHALRGSGASLVAICDTLRAEAIPARRGGAAWSPMTVARILKRAAR
jgi:DNA invertase Pin-like site-specific DNA recombinase